MQRFARRFLPLAVLGPLLAVLTACGGSSGGCGGGLTCVSSPTPPPPPPAANVTATGDGNLVLHPSIDPKFKVTLETPLKIQETAGGTANWDYARFSILQGGKEIERVELGSTPIHNGGYSTIAAKSTVSAKVLFRFNSPTFDDLVITLGFTDVNTKRQFTVTVPFNSFAGVLIGLDPKFLPADSVEGN